MTSNLNFKTKLSYGVGQAAEGIKNYAFSTFLLLYYNQVLGLSGSLAGVAIFIALCFDAFTDPIAGSISDNFQSKWGRRHPFMYASAIPLAIAFYFLFVPMDGLSTTGLFVWMTAFTILTRGAMTLYHVPHLALGAELSDHYTERTSIVGFRQFFSVAGNLAVIAVSFGYFFVDVDDQSGDLIAANYPPFAITLAIAMVITIFISGIGTHHRIPLLNKTKFLERAGVWATLAGVLKDTKEALTNGSFKWVAGATLSSFVMVGLQSALALYMANFFWELDDKSKALLLMATPAGFMVGIALTRRINERFDKRRTMIAGAMTYFIFAALPVILRLFDWMPDNGSGGLTPLLVGCGVVAGMGGVQAVVTANSMMADVADEHELLTERRQEGIFFGAISFAGKGASGVGSMIAGFGLDIISFPAGAVPGSVPDAVVFNLGAIYGPLLGVFAILAVWCMLHYKLTEERHAEIQALLLARKSAQANKD